MTVKTPAAAPAPGRHDQRWPCARAATWQCAAPVVATPWPALAAGGPVPAAVPGPRARGGDRMAGARGVAAHGSAMVIAKNEIIIKQDALTQKKS